MYLSKNIRYLRKQHGMSQEQVANAFGYDNYTTVQKWESEKADPPIKVVRGLAELFGVGIDDLVKTDLENAPMLSVAAYEQAGRTLAAKLIDRRLNDACKKAFDFTEDDKQMVVDFINRLDSGRIIPD